MEQENNFKRKRYSSSLSSLSEGSKLPPQAIDLEESVLGALMIEVGAWDIVNEILSSESFYKETHGMIFQAIEELKIANEPTDILTITSQLRKNEKLEVIGGAYFLTQLTNRVASAANIEFHARIIAEKFILRELIRISGEITTAAYDDSQDCFELLEETETKLQPIRDFLGGVNPIIPWSVMLKKEQAAIKLLAASGGSEMVGANTGNAQMNTYLGGFRKSDLIIDAARPSIGKTTRALAHGKAAALTGWVPVIFSLEMGHEQLVRKYIIEESEVWSSKFLHGDLNAKDLEEIDKAIIELMKLPITIIDKPGATPAYMKAIIRKIKKKSGKKILVIVDYLQLMNADGKGHFKGNREQEISSISRSLKHLAKSEDVPVLALSQLSRELERRANKRPILSDLRESGAIEQDADVVIVLYSPSYYYHEKTKDPDYKDEQDLTDDEYTDLLEMWILKNRHGAAGNVVKERFNKRIGQFKPLKPDEQPVSMAQDTSWQQGLDLFKSEDLPF